MTEINSYGIGRVNEKWNDTDKAQWLAQQTIKRSYQKQVVSKISALESEFDVVQYGELNYVQNNYPLFAIKTKNWDIAKPTILITGGVHGYETSGVHGAIRFVETKAKQYSEQFNIVVTPCISPWGYETINRWNPKAVDPNRSFYKNSPAPESAQVMAFVASLKVDLLAHIDLHETTDTDNSEFRPALAARDAIVQKNWNIPDGFYLVGDTINPCDDFQTAIKQSVEKVTHIAPADADGKLIGVELSQFGVINYPTKELGLCTGFSDAKFNTTTEAYPDSPLVDDENCIIAQVAVIIGALEYLIAQ